MHFWVFAARVREASSEDGSTVAKNTGLNWFIPLFENNKVGSSYGIVLEEVTNLC